MLRFIGLLVLLSISFAISVPVLACSGGMSIIPFSELVTTSDIIVRGTVGIVDDAGENAVITISEYLKGTPGSRYVLISQRPAWAILRDFNYDPVSPDCTSDNPSLLSGETAILFLVREDEGNYYLLSAGAQTRAYYQFHDNTSTVEIGEDIPPGTERQLGERADVTYAEFLQRLEALTGQLPTLPQDESYPRLAPLRITTEKSTQYVLPVDGSVPQRLNDDEIIPQRQTACWSVPCEIVIQFMDTTTRLVLPAKADSFFANAQAFSHSPNGDALAVWNHIGEEWTLDVAALWFDRVGYPSEFYTEKELLKASFPLELTAPIKPAAWSPDGRLLAFSDDRGVWVWDILLPEAAPQKVWDTPQIIQAFSPHGRFLILGEAQTGFSLDLISGTTYPPGLFSPDERLLLTTEAEYRVLNVPAYDASVKPLEQILNDERAVPHMIFKGAWEDSGHYIALICHDVTQHETCSVSRTSWKGEIQPTLYFGFDFDYLIEEQMLVVAQDDHSLFFDDHGRQYTITIDGWLDSPIVDVEWLPSLFYTKR